VIDSIDDFRYYGRIKWMESHLIGMSLTFSFLSVNLPKGVFWEDIFSFAGDLPRPEGFIHSLHAPPDPHFFKDVFHMGLDGAWGYKELLGQLLIAQPLSHQ
jgi:hypothetical protein